MSGLTQDEARALGFLLHSVLTTGGAQEDLGLGTAARSAKLKLDEAPVRRRDGVELARLWASLRREVEDRPVPLEVLVRVRREWLDMFGRICAAHLTGPLPPAAGEWTEVQLRFAAVQAARTLLSFGANVEVVWPASVRADLAEVAAEVVATTRIPVWI